jgi:hypothetical protein
METIDQVLFPRIGKAGDVALILGKSKKRVQNMASCGRFRKGIYIDDGRFNLSRLKECIEQGSYLRSTERERIASAG